MNTSFQFKKIDNSGIIEFTYFSIGDMRGEFSKIYEQSMFEQNGINFHLSESFLSVSSKNVIRGIHFQLNSPQAKVVCVLKGKVYDVAVDLRMDSPTYKKWWGFELSDENHKAIYVPRGFGHAFLSCEDDTYMFYQCEGLYDKETDTGIRYDDKHINIKWPIDKYEQAIHSDRDLNLMTLEEYEKSPMMV